MLTRQLKRPGLWKGKDPRVNQLWSRAHRRAKDRNLSRRSTLCKGTGLRQYWLNVIFSTSSRSKLQGLQALHFPDLILFLRHNVLLLPILHSFLSTWFGSSYRCPRGAKIESLKKLAWFRIENQEIPLLDRGSFLLQCRLPYLSCLILVKFWLSFVRYKFKFYVRCM